jgi:hypothetical protein
VDELTVLPTIRGQPLGFSKKQLGFIARSVMVYILMYFVEDGAARLHFIQYAQAWSSIGTWEVG